MDKDQFYNWEHHPLSHIIYLMVKWFNFDSVDMKVESRHDVESGIWYTIEIQPPNNTPRRWVHGQRSDIVKRRLIEFLDEQGIRKDYVKPKPTDDEV